MTDNERFAMAITALAESYRQKITPGLLHGYRMGLSGLSIDDIERGCALSLQRCKFMPVPAELREMGLAETVTSRWQRKPSTRSQAPSHASEATAA
jgi:hypothetical protein